MAGVTLPVCHVTSGKYTGLNANWETAWKDLIGMRNVFSVLRNNKNVTSKPPKGIKAAGHASMVRLHLTNR